MSRLRAMRRRMEKFSGPRICKDGNHLAEGNVEDPMERVFDFPVGALGGEEHSSPALELER